MIDRYKSPVVSNIWNQLSTYKRWHSVEMAWVNALNDLGIRVLLPDSIKILNHVAKSITVEMVADREATVHHDVAAFVDVMQEMFNSVMTSKGESDGDELVTWAANSYHFALTSSDVVDTASSIAFRYGFNALTEMISDLRHGIGEWTDHSHELVARTHGEIAGVMKAGDKIARYRESLQAHSQAINNLTFYGKFTGPTGLSDGFPRHHDVHIRACEYTGLQPCESPSQVIPRSVFSKYMFELASLGRTISTIALDFRLMISQGDLMIAKSMSVKGSSSMPHKVNPVELEKVCGLARMLTGYLTASLENQELWGERDISHSSVDRLVFEDAFHVVFHMIETLTNIIPKLSVDHENIQRAIGGRAGRAKTLSYSATNWLITHSKLSRATAYQLIKEWAAGDNSGLDQSLSKDNREEFHRKF